MSPNKFYLRLSIQPYAAVSGMLIVLNLFALLTLVPRYDFGGIAAILLGSIATFSPIVFIGTRYRVWVDGEEIFQRAANYHITKIKIQDINAVKLETSSAGEAVTVRRPYRRIAIYSRLSVGDFVDVSLKHFRPDDIRKLMRIIQASRPDLRVPKQWL